MTRLSSRLAGGTSRPSASDGEGRFLGVFGVTRPFLRRPWLAPAAAFAGTGLALEFAGTRLRLGGPLLPNSGLTVAVAWAGLLMVAVGSLLWRKTARVQGAGTLVGSILGW